MPWLTRLLGHLSWRLDKLTLIPSVGLAALTLVAGSFFQPVFESWSYLVPPLVGVVLVVLATAVVADATALRTATGVALQGLTAALTLPGLLSIPSARQGLPWPGAMRDLLVNLVEGPVRLLTSPIPARSEREFLSAPVLAAWLGFVTGWVVLRRIKPALSVFGPFCTLGVALAFGPKGQPYLARASIVFVGAILGYLTVLDHVAGRRPKLVGPRRLRLPVRGVVFLAGTLVVASAVAPRLPLVSTRDRFTLRDLRPPPFDPRNLASPLSGISKYFGPDARSEVLLRLTGATPSRLSLATLDHYDGRVWTIGRPQELDGSTFELVGSQLHRVRDLPGSTLRRTTVEIAGLKEPWVPIPGPMARLSTTDSRLRSVLRYDLRTDVLVGPSATTAGTQLHFDWFEPPKVARTALAGAEVDVAYGGGTPSGLPATVSTGATDFGGVDKRPYAVATSIAARLINGYYSEESDPGHTYGDLTQMLGAREALVGNDEQFAALFATMARSLDLPVRVVVGFKVPQPKRSGEAVELTGADVHAWAEIRFKGAGWVPFDATPGPERRPVPRPTRPEDRSAARVVPPVTVPPAESPESLAADDPSTKLPVTKKASGAFRVPGAVLYGGTSVVGAVMLASTYVGLVASFKARRRRRRRSGPPHAAIAGAWDELLERSLETGLWVAPTTTVSEVAMSLYPNHDSNAELTQHLGRIVENAAFAPATPTVDLSSAAWEAVDELRRRLSAEAGPIRRLRRLSRWRAPRGPHVLDPQVVLP